MGSMTAPIAIILQDISDLIEEALLSDNRLIVLAAILEKNIPLKVSPHLMMKLLRHASDQVIVLESNIIVTTRCANLQC